jgi:hypothetical protein
MTTVHLFVAVLDLVVREEEQLTGVSLVCVHAEGGYSEVLADRMPTLSEIRKLVRGLLEPSLLLRRLLAQPSPSPLTLLATQTRLIVGNERSRNLGDIDNDPGVDIHPRDATAELSTTTAQRAHAWVQIRLSESAVA